MVPAIRQQRVAKGVEAKRDAVPAVVRGTLQKMQHAQQSADARSRTRLAAAVLFTLWFASLLAAPLPELTSEHAHEGAAFAV